MYSVTRIESTTGDWSAPGRRDDQDRSETPPACADCGYGASAGPAGGMDAYGGRGRIVWQFEPMAILPATSRWKPQRDAARNIDVVFSGPSDLDLATVRLTVTPPPGGPATYTASIGAVSKVPGANDRYTFAWRGPWTFPENGQERPLPRGNYRLKVAGQQQGSSANLESGWYDKVSLVEVSSVSPFDLNGSTVDTNPPVPLITSPLPGQGEPTAGSNIRIARPGGGVRVFAEAGSPGGSVGDQLKLRAQITPAIPDAGPGGPVKVYFRILDVDDPDGPPIDRDFDAGVVNDNDGAGATASPSPANALTSGEVETILTFSHQPGDNYRVVASTTQGWLTTLEAVQPSTTGAVRDATLQPLVEGDQLSEMITVWRTLHVETDSMGAPPTEPSAAERNFIEGGVFAALGNGITLSILTLNPEVAYLPDGFLDRSPHLGGQGPAAGNGRFERGTIRVGVGIDVVVVTQLDGSGVDGNGDSFVRKRGGFVLPYRIVNAQGNQPQTGRLAGWDGSASARRFVLDRAVGTGYDGGSITVGGMTWTIQSVQTTFVTVVEPDNPKFWLQDDDPAFAGLMVSSALMQPVDDPDQNIFAPAYIRPLSVGAGTRPAASFKRNVNDLGSPDPGGEARDQLARGRDYRSTDAFWTVYLQGGVQEDNRRDLDAFAEQGGAAVYGWTPDYDSRGSLLFSEAARETVAALQRIDVTETTIWNEVVPHEIGHQFGLPDNDGGIMTQGFTIPGYFVKPHYFTPSHVRAVRALLRP